MRYSRLAKRHYAAGMIKGEIEAERRTIRLLALPAAWT